MVHKKRSYNQYCPIAKGLEIVGDRWTILILREILPGPKRYKDLLDGLQGIGTNLLAARMKDLEADGLVKKITLPPPSGATVYELTVLGRGLEPVLDALSLWGMPLLGKPKKSEIFKPQWLLQAMMNTFRKDVARGVTQTYQFNVDGFVYTVEVRDQKASVRQGAAHAPNVVVHAGTRDLLDLGTGVIEPKKAVSSGAVRLEGDAAAFYKCYEIFHLASTVA